MEGELAWTSCQLSAVLVMGVMECPTKSTSGLPKQQETLSQDHHDHVQQHEQQETLVASVLCAKATPPRGSYMAQSMVLREVKVFDKNYLTPTETRVRHLDGTSSTERSPRMSLDLSEAETCNGEHEFLEAACGAGEGKERRTDEFHLRRRSDTNCSGASRAAVDDALPPGSPQRQRRGPRMSLPASPQKSPLGKEDKEDGRDGQETKGMTARERWRRKLPLLKALKDEEVCEVVPGLYVGGVGGAKNRKRLAECGVTHVVNASPVIPCFYEEDFKYLVLQGFYDHADENIDEMITSSNAFIHEALGKNEGVYVHCYAGVSRGPTLAIAYLIQQGMPFLEAMRTVRRARPVVCPNTGFMEQLEVFEQRVKLEREVSQKLQEQVQHTLMEEVVDDEFSVFDMNL